MIDFEHAIRTLANWGWWITVCAWCLHMVAFPIMLAFPISLIQVGTNLIATMMVMGLSIRYTGYGL